MKKSEFFAEMSSKAVTTFKAIIKTEDLAIALSTRETTLGDTLIVATGSLEDIKILRSVYNMVKR